MTAGELDLRRVFADRRFARIGRDVEIIDATSSTNDHVRQRALEGAPDGLVVFAERQTAGRGRMGRSWHSPRGASVLCSLLLREAESSADPDAEVVGLIAGIACARAIRHTAGVDARILWPNDVVVGRRKIAGVLVETCTGTSGHRALVVGVGINCMQHAGHFPPELRDRATSIELESDVPVRREDVAAALLTELDHRVSRPESCDPDRVRLDFVEAAVRFDGPVRLRHGGRVYSGHVVDVDPSAALIVQMDDGMRRLFPTAGTSLADAYAAIAVEDV